MSNGKEIRNFESGTTIKKSKNDDLVGFLLSNQISKFIKIYKLIEKKYMK